MARRTREKKFAPINADIAETLNTLGDPENVIKLARIAAAEAMPMCAPALASLSMLPRDGLGTFATDKHYRMYYDPKMVERWVAEAEAVSASAPCETCGGTEHHPIAYVAGVMCHEVWHPLREHFKRSAEMAAEHRKWNVAADCEINDDLIEIFESIQVPKLCLPPGGCHPKKFDLDEGRMAEQYYFDLPESKQQCGAGGEGGECDGDHNGDCSSGGSPGWGDCGSACSGEAKDYEEGEPTDESPGLSQAEANCVKREVAENISKASAQRGNMPAGMSRWAEKTLEPAKTPWQTILKKACRWASGRKNGDDLRTYRRLGRRTAALGGRAIFPTTYSPAPSGAIVWDTSGSMDQQTMNVAATECDAIFKVLDCNLSVFTVDYAAGAEQSVERLRDIKFTGGGGTDMRVGITAALESRTRPGFVVVFTDGWTPWPSEPLANGVHLIICLVGDHACETNECPEWATVIKVDREEAQVSRAA